MKRIYKTRPKQINEDAIVKSLAYIRDYYKNSKQRNGIFSMSFKQLAVYLENERKIDPFLKIKDIWLTPITEKKVSKILKWLEQNDFICYFAKPRKECRYFIKGKAKTIYMIGDIIDNQIMQNASSKLYRKQAINCNERNIRGLLSFKEFFTFFDMNYKYLSKSMLEGIRRILLHQFQDILYISNYINNKLNIKYNINYLYYYIVYPQLVNVKEKLIKYLNIISPQNLYLIENETNIENKNEDNIKIAISEEEANKLKNIIENYKYDINSNTKNWKEDEQELFHDTHEKDKFGNLVRKLVNKNDYEYIDNLGFII